MGGDKKIEEKTAVDDATASTSTTKEKTVVDTTASKTETTTTTSTSTADAEKASRDKLLARKRKMSDASNTSTINKSDRKSDSNKDEGTTNKDTSTTDKRDKNKKRSERRRQSRRMTNNSNGNNNRGNSGGDNNRGFRPDDRRGPPPPGYGRGPPDDFRGGGGGRTGYGGGGGPPPHHHMNNNMPPQHFDPYGRAPPGGAFYGPPGGRGRGPPPHHFNNNNSRGPPGRWERGGGMGMPPHMRGPPRGPPHMMGRSMSSPNNHRGGHRNHHHNRRHNDNGRNDHDHRRSRRDRSHDSASSHSSRSRSLSQSSYSSSEGSYSSADDDDDHSRSRSKSHSRSRSPSPKIKDANQEEKQQKQDEKEVESKTNNKDTKTKEEEKSLSSKSSAARKNKSKSSRATKRNRSRSPSEGSRGRRRSRKGRRTRNRADSHNSSLTDRSLSQSDRSHHSSASSSSSHSSKSSRDDDNNSDYSGSERGGGKSRNREERRRKRRRRHKHRGSSSRRKEDSAFSKDQRTVFVSQLVMRTTERDIKKYFKKIVGCKVHDVSLLRDRRNARNHKGCAYVEVGRIEDVAKAVAVSGQPPDFQRFPILIKASEAEKNYDTPVVVAAADVSKTTTATNVDAPMSAIAAVSPYNNHYGNSNSNKSSSMVHNKKPHHSNSFLPPLKDENGNKIESQKVYVGGLDHAVTEQHLFALFSQFGTLLKVQLQIDLNTRLSRGYAFLSFHDPKVSNLAIKTMGGKLIAGRPLKTGWANQSTSFTSGCTIVTSEEFPTDAVALSQKALIVLAQMTGGAVVVAGGAGGTGGSSLPVSASASANNVAAGAVDGNKPSSAANNYATIDPTVHAAAALELSKAMLVPSKTTLSVDPSILATAEEELDRAMGLLPAFTDTKTNGGGTNNGVSSASSIPTVADARASLAATVAARQLAAATVMNGNATSVVSTTNSKLGLIGNADKPSRHLLVHNMYDKDEETDPGWEKDVKEEFIEECSKFGKIDSVTVMHEEPGGKIYASFIDLTCAKACCDNLAGRWFDKRQLRVDYMQEENLPLVK
jgi:RNA recognition motif-containing protein